jgi:hypothetical protein
MQPHCQLACNELTKGREKNQLEGWKKREGKTK